MAGVPPKGRRPNAEHLRSTYEVCLAKVLTNSEPTVEAMEDLAKIAVTYAMTGEGLARIKKDIAAAKKDGNIEREIILTKVVKKAALLLASKNDDSPTYIQIPLQAPRIQPVLGDRPIKDWDPAKPVWPKREVMMEAIQQLTKIPMADEELAKKVYRHLFSTFWRDCFYDNTLKIFNKPYNDDEGWRWRTFTIDQTAKMISEACIVKPKDLKPGMTIYNNFGVRVVSKLIPTGSAKFAREENIVKTLGVYSVQYTDGNLDRMIPDDTLFVHLPRFEKKNSGGTSTKNVPPLDLS